MATDIEVTDNPSAHRYELAADGERLGFVTYRLDNGVISFLHAEVDPSRERRGYGSALVAGALDDARARELKVQAVCPFVAAYIETHTEYRDLLA